MRRSVEISGKSRSTLTNYSRCLAHMGLYFKVDLLTLDNEQILDYLHLLKEQKKTPSESYFKHTVFGLRYLYRLYEKTDVCAALPCIKRPKKLPVVLNHSEVKHLLKAPHLLRHRLMLALLYGCGLRNFELCNLKITDLDLDRKMIHVREGKGRKDRFVPLCDLLIRGIRTYLESEAPMVYLFNGKNSDGEFVKMSARGVQKMAEVKKDSFFQLKP